MVHKRETIATEIVLISLDSFKDIIPGINNCVRIESQVKGNGILSKCKMHLNCIIQVVHNSEIYFLLCGGCNWHSSSGCDTTASSIFVYSMVTKVFIIILMIIIIIFMITKAWRKKMLLPRNVADLETDVSCINCCSADMMRLHLEDNVLFFLMLKDNRCTILRTDLANKEAEWQLAYTLPFETLAFEKTSVLKISPDKLWLMEERGTNIGGVRVIEISLDGFQHRANVYSLPEIGIIVGYEGQPYEGEGEFNWFMKATLDDLDNPKVIWSAKGNVDNVEDEITLGKYVIGGEESPTIVEKKKTSFCKIRNIRMDHGVLHIFAEQQDFKSAYLTYRVKDRAWTETQVNASIKILYSNDKIFYSW